MTRLVRRLIGVSGLAWIVGAACPARADVPPPARYDAWDQATTRHFTVFSNAGPEAAADVGRQLERLSEVFARTNPGLRSTSPQPTDVYAFRDEGSFRYYRPSRTEDISGWFQSGDDRDMIAINLAPEGKEAMEVLFHEYTHSYLRNNLVTLPLWLNEGLAEYYGATSTGTAMAEVGRPRPSASSWCLDHPLIPIDDLFAFTSDSPDYLRAGDRRYTFYAESWLLVHHLLQSTDRNAGIFEQFMNGLRRGGDPVKAFEDALPRDRWSALLAEVKVADQSTLRYLRYHFEMQFENADVRTEPMSRADILYRLGSLALHNERDQHEDSEAHFRAALEQDPNHAASMAALGYIADLRGQSVAAEERYAQALPNAGRDARPWIIAALGTQHRFFAEHPGPMTLRDTAPDLMLSVRERFAQALEREPRNPGALAGYGKTFTYQLEPTSAAIEALEQASLALPARTDVLIDLMVLYAYARGHAAADPLLYGVLEPRLSRAQVQKLQALILEADFKLAEGLSEQRKEAAAESLFRYIAAQTDDPRLRRAAESHLHAQVPDRAQNYNDAVALYNQGVASTNQGQYVQAIEWFTRASATARDSGLKSDAELRIREIHGTVAIQKGVALFNSGKLGEARKQLLSALTFPLDANTRAYVRRFIRNIDDRLKSGR